MAEADEHASSVQADEELLLRARPGRGGAHLTAQRDAGRFAPATADRLLRSARVRDVQARQAAVLLIEGEAGIGKSRLVQR